MPSDPLAIVLPPLLERLALSELTHDGPEVPVAAVRACEEHDVAMVEHPSPGGMILADGRRPLRDLVDLVRRVAPSLVLVHDAAPEGAVGGPWARATRVGEAVAGALEDAVSHVVPGTTWLVVVASPDTASRLEPFWSELRVSPAIRRLLEPLVDESHGGPAGDVAALRRLVERQERELADARQRLRNEDMLERRAERLQRELDRLLGRRSVRWVLKVAALFRPLFEWRRGDRSLADITGWSRRRTRQARRRQLDVGAPVNAGTPTGTRTHSGRFHRAVREVLEEGPDELIHAWRASEEALDAGSAAAAHDDTTPLVSIIMPTYNRADLLPAAIETITDQTYVHWELLVCDDGSEDRTEAVVHDVEDHRIRYLRLPHRGAAAARNAGLEQARGEIIAYLDTDNLWHPRCLETLVRALTDNPGRVMAYGRHIDVRLTPRGPQVEGYAPRPFDYERLSRKNFVDLNTLVHRRVLFERYGGFDEGLARQQDWDLVLKYAFVRDPLYVDRFLTLYRRNEEWDQITDRHRHDRSTQPAIEASVAAYHRSGPPRQQRPEEPARFTVLSWDVCRNHYSKAFNLAEALTADDPRRARLVGFRFFDEPVFPPYADVEPPFEQLVLPGGTFPEFGDSMARAVAAVRGDVVYAVKPRLPSLGVGLLANYHFGTPLVVEANDLESAVTAPRAGQAPEPVPLDAVDPADPRLREPHGELWTQIMEELARQVPLRATHNHVLDDHLGGGAFYVRNPKDETWFDPDRYDRDAERAALGIGPEDRVLLFGGMVRRHKGIFELADAVQRLGSRWRLLVVGSRDTPDQRALRDLMGERVQVLESVDRNAMARVNLAADAVVLWLDPDVPASHYQMPFKLTDALAMRVPVVASPIGELEHLGREGYLRLVPFGDRDALVSTLSTLMDDGAGTRAMVEAARRLYLRQFSYRAVRESLELVADAARSRPGPLPVAETFARLLADVRAATAPGGA